MDARAFGALPSRTERRVSRFGRPEWLFMAAAWTAFCNLLAWQNRFTSKNDLISWIEGRKLSG